MSGAGEKCGTCYGEGQVPTDQGMVPCPDCGGAGDLPPAETLVEWRLREIERAHGPRGDQTADDIRWLAFELRRARGALTELVTLAEDLDESPTQARIRFVGSRALGLYEIQTAGAAAAKK